jgi:hypothetical protein
MARSSRDVISSKEIEIVDSKGVNISSSTIAAGIIVTQLALTTFVKLVGNFFIKSYNGGTITETGSPIISKKLNDFIDGSDSITLNN